MVYGDSQKYIGNLVKNKLKITTKLPPIPSNCDDLNKWTDSKIRKSLKELKAIPNFSQTNANLASG